jgi:hypothetical protein
LLAAFALTSCVTASSAKSDAACEPPRALPPSPNLAPNSTYTSDSEPPRKYRGAPSKVIRIQFGQDAIDELCGRPCGGHFEGCVRGDQLAILDPFKISDEAFGRLMRHELAHENGWPETHGD